MSLLLPYLISDALNDYYRPQRYYRPSAAILDVPSYRDGLLSELNKFSDILNSTNSKLTQNFSQIVNQDGIFKVNVDVQQFKPEEIDVKVVDDFLVIEAKHEERKDKHGYVSRQFTRRYKLPEGVNLEAIKSSISSDGVLTVVAPTKVESVEGTVRQIPVTFVKEPAIQRQAENPNENAEKK